MERNIAKIGKKKTLTRKVIIPLKNCSGHIILSLLFAKANAIYMISAKVIRTRITQR